jgi:hypothetical protein
MRVGAVSGMPLLAPESFGVMHKAQVRLEAGESSIEIDSVQFCTSVRLVTDFDCDFDFDFKIWQSPNLGFVHNSNIFCICCICSSLDKCFKIIEKTVTGNQSEKDVQPCISSVTFNI